MTILVLALRRQNNMALAPKIDPGQIIKIDTSKPYNILHEIYDLVPETDPILKEVMPPFDFKNPPTSAPNLATNLFETMFAKKGLGLSANQCGLRYRVFVVGYDNSNKQVFFNPEIAETSVDQDIHVEGCLSYPALFLKVKRPTWIVIKYQHVDGELRENRYEGLTARVILHEMDHMDGKLFTERVGPTTLALARDKRKKTLRKIERNKP